MSGRCDLPSCRGQRGGIRMLRTDGDPELRVFDPVIRFLHWLTLLLVATTFVLARISHSGADLGRSARESTGKHIKKVMVVAETISFNFYGSQRAGFAQLVFWGYRRRCLVGQAAA